MVDFNELRITSDGQYLIIDVTIKSDLYYKDRHILNIKVDTQDTYIDPKYASSEAYILYDYEVEEDRGQLRHLRITADSTMLGDKDLENNMFFVYVQCSDEFYMGETAETKDCYIPCGADETTTVGTVMASYPYYEQAMSYLGELSQNCVIPKDFIDFILRTKAMELAVKTGNYPEAIKYYNKFFKDGGMYSDQKGGCGCGAS